MPRGRLSEIWRYPVSGLQGEKLEEAMILETGLAGDHLYAVRGEDDDKLLDPLSHASSLVDRKGLQCMLEFQAILSGDPGGEHEVTIRTGRKTVYSSTRPGDTAALSAALGRRVEVIRYPRIVETRVRAGRTVHLLTDASLEQIRLAYTAGDFDVRRFRPNLMLRVEGGPRGFAEEAWIGRDLSVGDRVRLHVKKANERCKRTTMKQAGIKEDGEILETIRRENSNHLGIMCSVLGEGLVRVGDLVSLA